MGPQAIELSESLSRDGDRAALGSPVCNLCRLMHLLRRDICRLALTSRLDGSRNGSGGVALVVCLPEVQTLVAHSATEGFRSGQLCGSHAPQPWVGTLDALFRMLVTNQRMQ